MSAAGLRVVELCEGIEGPLCGRHLLLLGAEVGRVEPAGGDRARAWGRRAPGALHDLLADGKARVGPDDAREADVVLADEGREVPPPLDRDRPRLVVRFDRERLADDALAGTDTVVQTLLGLVDYVSDRFTDPSRTGGDVAAISTALAGVQTVLAWILGPPEGEAVVHVSPLRSLAALKTVIWGARTGPDEWSGSHVTARDRTADCGYRVRDGWVTMDYPHTGGDDWRRLIATLGLQREFAHVGDDWWETVGWGDAVDWARPHFQRAFADLTREQACDLIRAHAGSSVPFQSAREALDHPQTHALGAAPGGLPWRTLVEAEPARLRAPAGHPTDRPPLEGFRVIDFGVGGVSPYAGTLLAQLGADVLKVEAPNEFIHAVRPTRDGLSSTYSALNAGKRSVRLNLKDEADRELAYALLEEADVVLENFRPGAMARLGLAYDDLAGRFPQLVYCSASGFGSEPPLASLQCTDPHIQAFGGWALGNAGPAGAPRRTRYYAMLDCVAAMCIAEAVLAGLVVRESTGSGSYREVSMLGSTIHLHTSRWVGWAEAAGVDEPGCERLYAPDGIFATTDGHVAVSIEDDASWRRLRAALGDPPSLARAGFDANAGRLAHEPELAAALGDLLATKSSSAWTQLLARHDVPAGRHCQDDDVVLRGDLWERDLLRMLERSGLRPTRAGGPMWAYPEPLPVVGSPLPGADDEALRADPVAFWRPRARARNSFMSRT